LNGLKELGQGINRKEVRIKEVLVAMILVKLKEISDKICTIPSEKKIHKTIQKILEQRKNSVTKGLGIDWSTAEALAFGSLLEEGYPVRLVGQDSARGTFSQRHSVLKNQDDSSRYIPLNNISKNQKRFEVIDSFLSELAVLGFEYGYSLVEPNTLTLWEAQFGDFCKWSSSCYRSVYCFWRKKMDKSIRIGNAFTTWIRRPGARTFFSKIRKIFTIMC